MPSYEEIEAMEHVRSFCDHLRSENLAGTEDQHDELERALMTNADAETIRKQARIKQITEYLESDGPKALEELARRRSELAKAYGTFVQAVEKESKSSLPRNISSCQDVNAVVETVIDDWNRKKEGSKFRQGMEYLRKFCNTIDTHSTALKMLPTNNEYVSLFYGALATIIKASATYTSVMEALPKHLVEINQLVGAVQQEVWLFDTNKMKALMWRMYSQIFSFLVHFIEWYKQRGHLRLLKSLNEKLPEFFSQKLTDVRNISEEIRRQVQFHTSADAHLSRLYAETMNDKFLRLLQRFDSRTRAETAFTYDSFKESVELRDRKELQDPSRQKELMMALWHTMVKKETGATAARLLGEEATSESLLEIDESPTVGGQDTLSQASAFQMLALDGPVAPAHNTVLLKTKTEIIAASRHLEDFFEREKAEPMDDMPAESFAPSGVVSRLKSWATSTESKILYVSEPFELGQVTRLSGIAAQYAALARGTGLPVVSYFCRLSREEPPPRRTNETIELVSLVYSMIRQLIELLPPRLDEGEANFSTQSFVELHGTLTSWRQACKLLENLLRCTALPILIIVINGLEKLDDRSKASTEEQLEELVQVLKSRVADGEELHKLKVLFTTSGESVALNAGLDVSDTLLTDSPPRRGQKSMRPYIGTVPL